MKQREVKEPDGTTWTCVEAYSGLNDENEERASKLTETEKGVPVVCTPSGGAQTVRLRLNKGWIDQLTEEELLNKILSQNDSGPSV